jgi:MFS family permease
MSERSQIAIVWWALIFTTIYGLALGFMLHMIGPPSATLTADQVKDFYLTNQTSIRWGATIASWTSMFMAPLWGVIAAQIWRQEKGRTPIWTLMAGVNGPMMGLFLALPPLFWGVAAFSPDRPAEVTAAIHELGLLTLTTTDQVYIFNYVAVVVIALLPQAAKYSPFPRWYGYFTAFWALAFEVGAFAFNFRSGPFSWNGIIVFWMPLTGFGLWILVTSVLLIKALKQQLNDKASVEDLQVPVPA